ncbi:RluA family pseudouridine synthase [Pontibacillus yanchengensis]|uniref:RluA family pseudouridine synthase n=2 Tax=Pontibacillus yanchengensis TaxID=462910 RepID=A0ACC7VDJ2_9BACI|nr:RluA family pseudouridine synthase [Pontibacillus yanchengensis]MYL32391.1 RluA family pseudouridine synthase [Pontibacillus yanchengensis]MYL52971.1 RluA family pseudouridine synthase [Pontibacillus yanchengensis]
MKNKQKKSVGKTEPKQYTVEEETTLLPYLQKILPNRSRNAVKSILTRGQVAVNGERVTQHNHPLVRGQRITIYKDNKNPALQGVTILFEDNDLMVIEKEAGLLSMASSHEKTMTAYRQLSDYVKTQHPKNRIFIVHRLDRDTSGVMIFSKSELVKHKFQESWKKVVEERVYIALVEGKVQKSEGTITSWLNETKTHMMYSSPKPNNGKKAVTHYKLLQSNINYSLLEVRLDTGRKNQIRVHMQDIGHSIVGDKKYGSTHNPIGRLGLHAKEITFVHPSSVKSVHFESKTPKAFLDKVK